MNHGRITPLLLAAAAAVTCLAAVQSAPAQTSSGPVAPFRKMEFQTVDPLGGAKLPHPARGAAGSPRTGKKPGSGYYSSSDPYPQAGVKSGASGYTAPGTTRQPIRARRGGSAQYPGAEGRRGTGTEWTGSSRDIPNMYR